MKRFFVSIVASFVLLPSTTAQNAQGSKWEFHREILKHRFDTAYWKSLWEEDIWHIRAIFVDMNGDGLEEMIAITTSEEDRTGDYWNIWKYDAAGKFRQVLFSGDVFFSCHSESFYKIVHSDKSNMIVGLGMNANIEENCGNGERRIVRSTPDCTFVLMPGNKFMLREIQPDVDTLFRRKDVTSIERLYPEWYFGYDFRPPKDTPYSVYTQRMPYRKPMGDLRPGGGMDCPDDFAAFVAEYRRRVKMRMGKNDKATVYAIFLDADNDGDCDCYVSSDMETAADGEYIWSLFLYDGGRFLKVKNAVFPVEARKDLCKLPTTVNAGKESFCRVIRYDVPPTFVVANKDNKSKSPVRDAITDNYAHRIEKLDCKTFPETFGDSPR